VTTINNELKNSIKSYEIDVLDQCLLIFHWLLLKTGNSEKTKKLNGKMTIGVWLEVVLEL
jgi:hypothetical protein